MKIKAFYLLNKHKSLIFIQLNTCVTLNKSIFVFKNYHDTLGPEFSKNIQKFKCQNYWQLNHVELHLPKEKEQRKISYKLAIRCVFLFCSP